MIIRLSQKLKTKIKAGTLGPLPLHENPLADWSAHLFLADRTQYILLSNTKSLYSTVLYGKGITNANRFIEQSLNGIQETMKNDGLEAVYHRSLAPAGETVEYAKALNRSVTGSMNELVTCAMACLIEGGLSPYDVSIELNRFLLSAAARTKSEGYGEPRDAFKAMVENARL